MVQNWQEHGQPFLEFTAEITKYWSDLGFSKNTCKEWLEVGLKALDYDFAYYLELQGYNPEWVLNHGSDKDLRKDYKKFLKRQPKKKQPKVQPEKPRDLYSCKICDNNTFLTWKQYIRLHGKHKLNLKNPWVVKLVRPFKNIPGFISKAWICVECKEEKHKKDCSWYQNYEREENARKKYADDLIRKNNEREELIKKIFDDLKVKNLQTFLNNYPEWNKELEIEIKRNTSNWANNLSNTRELLKTLWRELDKWETKNNTHPDQLTAIKEIKKAFTENGNWQDAVYV